MQNYNKNKKLYLTYCNDNTFYGWTMPQKLPVNNLECEKTYKSLMRIDYKDWNDYKNYKEYNKNSDLGYIFEVDVEYPKLLYDSCNDLPFLTERMKIKKCQTIVCKLKKSMLCM